MHPPFRDKQDVRAQAGRTLISVILQGDGDARE